VLHGRYFPDLITVISAAALFGGVAGLLALLVAGRVALPRLVPRALVEGVAVGAAALAAWQGLVALGVVDPVLLPPPTVVFSNLGLLWQSGFLQPQVVSTLLRFLQALALAVATAVPLGILIGRVRPVSDYLEPVLHMVRMIPSPVWAPLGLLWFGLGQGRTIFIIWLGAFFPILLNALTASRRADPVQVDTVRTFGGDAFDVAWEVIIPSAVPLLLTGVRVGMGIGWVVLLAAELCVDELGAGIGWMINDARVLLDMPTVLSGMLVIGAMGIALDASLRSLEARYMRRYAGGAPIAPAPR
jgi:NitT/TauT family transport system permease protein/sulfonate transport system permease protein